MRFKVDENLPVELADLLTDASHDATTVITEGLQGQDDSSIFNACLAESRALITLDLDFADLRRYPPQLSAGLIVLRLSRQDKAHVLEVFRRVVQRIGAEPLERHLWIVEESRIRIRGGAE